MSKPSSLNKVIISGGGTGGHIFPALAIAEALRHRYPSVGILFIGAEGRMEMERVPQAGYPIQGLPIMGLDRRRPWRNLKVIARFLKSLSMARDIIRSYQPDVVIGVGGYASAPTLKAAQSLGIPTLIQEQNSYAGLTNKMLARRAQRICVAYPEMERFFPKDKIVLTGNPLRPIIESSHTSREEALSYFGFAQDAPTMLVVGGSLGARSINQSIAQGLDRLTQAGIRVIWQTGRTYTDEYPSPGEQHSRLVWRSTFIDRMDYAYALADIVVSRAGASSISELCALGKACILVPSPNVAEDHQTKNALALSTHGAAILIPDTEATNKLVTEAIALIQDSEKRQRLSAEIHKLAQLHSADRIVDEIVALLSPEA